MMTGEATCSALAAFISPLLKASPKALIVASTPASLASAAEAENRNAPNAIMIFMAASFAFALCPAKRSIYRPGGTRARDDPGAGNFLQGDRPIALVDNGFALLHVGEGRGIGRIGTPTARVEKERLSDLQRAACRLDGLVVRDVVVDPAGAVGPGIGRKAVDDSGIRSAAGDEGLQVPLV